MSRGDCKKTRRLLLDIILARNAKIFLVFMFFFLLSSSSVAYAVRANWGVRQMGPRLEEMGRHEEAAFYYRAGLDFYTSILQLWIGAVYDEQVDEIYRQYAEAFGEEGWRSADYEERWDTMRAYLFFFNQDGVARNVEKGNFSAAQRTRIEDRMRIYIEDLIDPNNGFGGDFSFSRKAWILERTGLFWHAAFRRELAGRYAIRVCSRYYAAIADEMERVFGDQVRAKLYRQKAEWWRSRGLEEFHLCNGDRVLARLKGNNKLKRLNRDEVIAVLKKGLRDENVDARRAAVRILSEMEELAALEQAMEDSEAEIRKATVAIFADKMYLPGLALALKDTASEISAIARDVLEVKPEPVGPYLRAVSFLATGLKDEGTRIFSAEQLRRLSGLELGDSEVEWRDWVHQVTAEGRTGALVEYFSEPSQTTPVTAKVFETVDIGMKFQANFPKVWYDYWDKPEIFPAEAEGPFLLRITSKLYIPADGKYRFYVKTIIPNQATLSIEAPDNQKRDIISPRNEENLQYVMQAGMSTHRIDFSEPIPLKKGLVKLLVDYRGNEVRNIRKEGYDHIVAISGVQKVGIQLFWSSDNHLMELVPAANLFHSSVADSSDGEIFQLIKALSGDNAVAEWKASRKLVELGDVAVPAVAELAGSPVHLAPRLLAVEVLGEIGTKSAMDALLDLLKRENNLAVRGQLCTQLGYARERRVIPIIAEWLGSIGPKSLNDVRGPKEVQPSTCYIRHVEALGMIDDESAIPILEEFKKNIPQKIGYGGFVTNFVTGAVNQTLADIRDSVVFWKVVGQNPGLAEKIAPLFGYFQTNNVAKFRHYKSEVVRGTEQGKVIILRLTKQTNSKLAMAAKSLLDEYNNLKISEGGEER